MTDTSNVAPTLSAPETLSNGKATYQCGDGIALITLTNAPANGYSHEMMLDLDQAILRARFDDDIAVIVLAGAGEKFFCAGADIGMLETITPTFKYAFCLHANETLLRLEHTPKLVIGALGGHCVGGGLEVALACDLRLARKGSGRCGLPEVALGVLPGTGGTQRLARTIGKSRSIEMMASGRLVDYAEALELQLVDRLIDADDDTAFMNEVLCYARTFCAPGRAPLAVGAIKRSVQSGLEMTLESGLALERELQAHLFHSSDAKEGMSAFLEKRTPRFEGK